jgi:cAMP-dependent protein kinase regulator
MYHSEEELQKYLQQHQVHEILVALAESICLERPSDVPRHMVQFLNKHFINPCGSTSQKKQWRFPVKRSARTMDQEESNEEAYSEEEETFGPFSFASIQKRADLSVSGVTNGNGAGIVVVGGAAAGAAGGIVGDMENDGNQYTEIDLESSENRRRRYSVIDRRGAVSSESLDNANVEITATRKKSPEEKLRIKTAIEHNPLFSSLDDEEMDKLFDAMDNASFEPGEIIIKQGDEGELFYIIDKGSVDVFKDDKLVTRISEGGSFGELALIYGTPRAATVKASAKEGCKCWTINRLIFRKVLMDTTIQKRKKYEDFLKKVRILETLDDYERMTIADALESATYHKGQTIVKQGEYGDSFYIIVEGTVEVYKENEKGERINLGRLSEGDYFGEIALLLNQPRAATVVVPDDCEQVKVVKLDRRSFKNLLGNIEDLLKRNMSLYNQFMSTQI